MISRIPCITCEKIDFQPFYTGLIQCKNCSHIVADMNISDEELRNIYNKNYFFGDEYVDYINDNKVLRKNFQLRLRSLSKFLDKDKHKSLLEVGCAYGFFLDEAKSFFDDVRGFDITEDGINYAKNSLKINAELAEFADISSQKSVDVGCMWDTIEHLRDPHLYLEKFSELIPKDGLLCITTGDISSLMARWRKEKWRLIHPPTHIHYFSMKTLRDILSKYGFDVIHTEYCGFYRSVEFTLYNILVLRLKYEKLYNFYKKLNINFDFYLNTYDIMYMIGKKR
jgi:2-polyprenyl-3-methyl-5-hydroxy-6-metoxy-1,4-benzoquinol methylase